MADIDGLNSLRIFRPGQMVAMFGDTPPTRTLVCNGGAVFCTLHADFFAVIEIKYGIRDGPTTFNVSNVSAGFSVLSSSSSGVGTTSNGSLISHAHSASSDVQELHNHYWDYQDMCGTSLSGGGSFANAGGAYRWAHHAGNHVHNIYVAANGGTYNYVAGMQLLICIAF